MTSRFSGWLARLLLLAALPVLAASDSAWDEGAWVGTVREQELHLSLHPKDKPGEQHGFSTPLTAFQGLSTRDGDSPPFKLVREAGTFTFEGRFTKGQGTGTWRYTPDAGYAKALADLGVEKPDAHEQLTLALVDVGPARVRALAALGHRVTSMEDLVQVGIFGVTPESVKAMAAAGYPKLTLDELVQTRIHGVTPERIQALAAVGFKGLELDTLMALSIHGVTPDFIQQMRDLGYPNATPDELVQLRIHGITPDFIRAMSKGAKDKRP